MPKWGSDASVISTSKSSALHSPNNLIQVLESCLGRQQEGPGSFEMSELLGLFGWTGGAGQGGISGLTFQVPELVRQLNEFVASRTSDFTWSALQVLRNPSERKWRSWVQMSSADNWVVTFGRFQGGGLWVEGDEGEGGIVGRGLSGVFRMGRVLEVQGNPTRFRGDRRFCLEPWQGDLWMLRAWTPEGQLLRDPSLRSELASVGFRLQACEPPKRNQEIFEYGMFRTLRNDGDQVDQATDAETEKDLPTKEGQMHVEEWQVHFPHQLVDDEWLGRGLSVHESVSGLRKRLSQELSGAPLNGGDLMGIATDLRLVTRACEWWEGLLAVYQPADEVPISIRSLASEVPLRSDEPPVVDQFLQTRTVSLEEARRELDCWRQPAEDELRALEVTTGAVERVTAKEVEEWVKGGRKVIQVPGKAVLTRKSGIGKRRFRAVCCGNFVPLSELNVTKDDLYAGGVDAITFRVVLSYVAQYPLWSACTLDIKTAFLNAPVRGGGSVAGGQDPLIIVRPPFMLVQLGLMQSHHRWLVHRALYGLQTSPRDWAQHRDKVLAEIKLTNHVEASLVQSVTDDSLWLLKGASQRIEAVVIVYVDDMAVFGPRDVLVELVDKIRSIWTISGPDWVAPDSPLSFCGMELARTAYGWKVTQERYLRELLARYEIQGVASCPMIKFEEPPLEEVTSGDVKDAQGITGALMRAVTRSRPDLMFVTSKMSQWQPSPRSR